MAGFDEYMRESLAVLEATRRGLDSARVEAAVAAATAALAQDKPLLVCGNGGSAADAMHITAELVGRFLKERRALKAISLAANTAAITAWSNDYDYATVFSRQVEAYGEKGGALIAISTSGNSANVLEAAKAARSLAMTVIALTGEGGGKLAPLADILLAVPSRSTPLIQQAHICIYHYLCAEIEARIAAR
jgi:D-sedoheptulose 7-phosphate isomerase